MKSKLLVMLAALAIFAGPVSAWQPSQEIEIVVPGGKGGGGDQMARAMADIIKKNKLAPVEVTVSNKTGGSGTEGYMYVKGKKGDNHTLLITLANLFTLPVAMGAQYQWNELTPLARMALDEFALWVNADTPYKTVADYVKAAKASPNTLKMGGTGAAQEDQIVTSLLEQASDAHFVYVPLKGGGDVAKALAAKQIDSSVNNPSEADELWQTGKVRPLAVFDTARIPLPRWKEVPTMKEKGYDASYLMLRGVFGAPDMSKEASAYYVKLLEKVFKSAEFQKYVKDGALNPAWQTGPQFTKWLEQQDQIHRDLLGKLGLK